MPRSIVAAFPFNGQVSGWRILGLILIVTGIGVLSIGIWNHVTGPPLDYDPLRSDPNKIPVPQIQNVIVYVWAGVTILGGLLLAVFATGRAKSDQA